MAVTQIHTDMICGESQNNMEWQLPVVRISMAVTMDIDPDSWLFRKTIWAQNYTLLVNESAISANSKNITTGNATKNNESGSGGESKAPIKNEVNQICLL